MLLDLQAIQALKAAGAKSFGAKLWEETAVIMTVTPEQYTLKESIIPAKAGIYEEFVSRQVLIDVPGSSEVLAINLKAEERYDDTLTYNLVQFTALRDSDTGSIEQGDTTVKAVAQ